MVLPRIQVCTASTRALRSKHYPEHVLYSGVRVWETFDVVAFAISPRSKVNWKAPGGRSYAIGESTAREPGKFRGYEQSSIHSCRSDDLAG